MQKTLLIETLFSFYVSNGGQFLFQVYCLFIKTIAAQQNPRCKTGVCWFHRSGSPEDAGLNWLFELGEWRSRVFWGA